MKRFCGVALLFVIVAAIAAGCGGDDEATASLSRQQFVKEANAVCKAGERERTEIIEGATKLFKPGEVLSKERKEEFVQTGAVDPYRKMTEQLTELGTPEGEEEQVEAVIEEMERAADKAEENPIKALTSIAPFAAANKAVTDYGIDSCAV